MLLSDFIVIQCIRAVINNVQLTKLIVIIIHYCVFSKIVVYLLIWDAIIMINFIEPCHMQLTQLVNYDVNDLYQTIQNSFICFYAGTLFNTENKDLGFHCFI